MLTFLLVSWVHFATGLIEKQTTLNSQIKSQNGASITLNPVGYDLKLSLNNSWAFASSTTSKIYFTIYGFSYFPQLYTNIFFVFHVANFKYFTFALTLNNNTIQTRISSSIPIQNNTHVQNISELVTMDQDNDNQSLFPLKFAITNKPIKNESMFEFYLNNKNIMINQSEDKIKYIFCDSFVSNQIMDISMMGNINYSSFNIDILKSTHKPYGLQQTSSNKTVIFIKSQSMIIQLCIWIFILFIIGMIAYYLFQHKKKNLISEKELDSMGANSKHYGSFDDDDTYVYDERIISISTNWNNYLITEQDKFN